MLALIRLLFRKDQDSAAEEVRPATSLYLRQLLGHPVQSILCSRLSNTTVLIHRVWPLCSRLRKVLKSRPC